MKYVRHPLQSLIPLKIRNKIYSFPLSKVRGKTKSEVELLSIITYLKPHKTALKTWPMVRTKQLKLSKISTKWAIVGKNFILNNLKST